MDRLYSLGDLVEEGILHILGGRLLYHNGVAATLLKQVDLLLSNYSKVSVWRCISLSSRQKVFDWQRSMQRGETWSLHVQIRCGGSNLGVLLKVKCVGGALGRHGEYIIILKQKDGVEPDVFMDIAMGANEQEEVPISKNDSPWRFDADYSDDFFLVGLFSKHVERINSFYEIDRRGKKLLVDLIAYPVFLLNDHYDVIFANDAAEKAVKEKLGSSNTHLISRGLKNSTIMDGLENFFKDNQQETSIKIGVTASGILYERACVPIDKEGKVVGMMMILREINNFERELLLLGMNRKLPSTFLDVVHVQILKLDCSLRVVYANRAFKDTLGYSEERVVGCYIGTLIKAFESTQLASDLKLILKEEVNLVKSDVELVRADGRKLWVEVCAARSTDNDHIGEITLTMSDISHRKRQEFDLQQQLLSMKNMKDKMEKFYSIIGHDVKNSMITNQMIASNLLSTWNQSSDETIKTYIGYIAQLSNEGIDLLDNLVAWTKGIITGIEFSPSLIHLKPLMAELERHFMVSAKYRGITLSLEVDESCYVYGDKNMLRTVFRNLVSNAIKFNKRGGVVTVSVQRCGMQVVVCVGDNGPGFNDTFPAKSYTDEYQEISIDDVNEKGFGIGLAICRNFIQNHGGRISLFSRKGYGTKVVVELDLAK